MSTHNLCFEQKYENYQKFLSENFQFLEVKFSIYLNKHVFVMGLQIFWVNIVSNIYHSKFFSRKWNFSLRGVWLNPQNPSGSAPVKPCYEDMCYKHVSVYIWETWYTYGCWLSHHKISRVNSALYSFSKGTFSFTIKDSALQHRCSWANVFPASFGDIGPNTTIKQTNYSQ